MPGCGSSETPSATSGVTSTGATAGVGSSPPAPTSIARTPADASMGRSALSPESRRWRRCASATVSPSALSPSSRWSRRRPLASRPPTSGDRAPSSAASDQRNRNGCGATMASPWPRRCATPISTRIGFAAARRDDLEAFIELHIEQGPFLEREDLPVGIVEQITGYRQYLVTLEGAANHAGTTPDGHAPRRHGRRGGDHQRRR